MNKELDYNLTFKKVLLKISGEALSYDSFGMLEPAVIEKLVDDIVEIVGYGVKLGIVVGGGNICRGSKLCRNGIDRITADHMGMLATIMNALALRGILEKRHISTRVMSSIPMSGIVDHYDRRKAIHHLSCNRVVIFSGGTGNPLVTTDSAASLRGIEIGADVLLKATHVDGVYTEDPVSNPHAIKYDKISYQEALDKELGVMDLAAFSQCRDYKLPIMVFNINNHGALSRIVKGQNEGTLVS